jgi:hypothetical protein
MTKFTNTIFTAISYPDFSTSKSVNLTASTYFADNNYHPDYSSMAYTLDKLGINNLIVLSITKKDVEIIEKEYKSDLTIIKNIIISYNQFFTETGVKQILIEQDLNITITNGDQKKEIKPSFIIYCFEETS